MRIRELSEHESLALLERSELGRLACVRDEQPYIVPIHFSFDAGARCLYTVSAVGQKIDWMRQNPKVCVEVEDVADKDHWTTVLIFGRYEELGDSANHAAARGRAQELFQSRPEWWFPAAARTGSRDRQAMVLYRIEIDRITGRQAARSRA